MSKPSLWIALGLVAVIGVAYLLAPSGPAPAPTPAASPAEAPPGAENVDPSVHAQLMRLKAAADAAPDDAEAQLAFARFAAGAHRQAEAVEALERAVARAPERRQPWLDLAHAYGAAEDWDAVAEASERMLARFPGDASAQYNLGAAHANAGRAAEARAAWTAVAAGPDAGLAGEARASLQRLATMASAPPAGGAPPLAAGQTELPAGHPPLGASPSRPYVVPGGRVTDDQADRARTLLTELKTLE